MILSMYDLVIDLSWVFFWIWELPCPCHFLFQIKEVNVEMSQNQFVFQTDPWEIVAGVVFDMHKDTYPLSIFSEEKIEGEVLQESVLPPRDMMLLDFDHWHLLFHASRKTRPPSIKELFKWPSTVHVFLQFCCGNMRTHTDISITYARLRVGPVDAITVCAILSHSESQRLPDRHT